ncbi:MAG: spermidine/putrescine ABC transporter substrate-binding protein [Clostridia bacterium]|nr:spermidine/putrescine ABC transporter substrate-binding protein [Clostridia bacterium]
MKKVICILLVAVFAFAALTACSKSETKKIYLYNWSDYMSQEVLDLFKEEYGIEVVVTTFESNDEMFAKLVAGGNSGYDIAVPTNFYIEAMLSADLIEELDKDAMTNLGNIDEAYRNMSYDPEGKYTVPYMGTVCVWVADKEKLASLGVEINSYEDLLNENLKNQILMTDDSQGNISIALTACGLSETDVTTENVGKAKEWLLKLNPNVKAYDIAPNVRDSMLRGESAVAYMYGGNAVQAMLENKNLEVVLEDKPCSLSVDTFVILKGTQHKEESELFLNFLLRPEISAMLTKDFPYVSFNKAAVEKMDKELAENPLIVLSETMKKNLYLILSFNADIITAEVDAMTEVKNAR